METENTNQTVIEMLMQQLEEEKQYVLKEKEQALEQCDSFKFGYACGCEYAESKAIIMLKTLNENYELTPKNK